MPEVIANGVRLFYTEHGAGEPILGIHGGGSTALLWEDAAERLGRLGRAIAYDRRGCARSERPQPYRTSVAEQAADAAALLEVLDAAPAVIVGRSYGGTVALELALRRPELVRALVLLEADAFGVSRAGREWTRTLADRLHAVAERDGVDAVYEALIDEVAGEGVWETIPAELRRTLTDNGPALLAELAFVHEPLPDAAALATIRHPALVVAATESPAPMREMSEEIAHALPNARLSIVGGGHLIDPAAPEVLAFIGELSAPAR